MKIPTIYKLLSSTKPGTFYQSIGISEDRAKILKAAIDEQLNSVQKGGVFQPALLIEGALNKSQAENISEIVYITFIISTYTVSHFVGGF